jgi:hypothetical protein
MELVGLDSFANESAAELPEEDSPPLPRPARFPEGIPADIGMIAMSVASRYAASTPGLSPK